VCATGKRGTHVRVKKDQSTKKTEGQKRTGSKTSLGRGGNCICKMCMKGKKKQANLGKREKSAGGTHTGDDKARFNTRVKGNTATKGTAQKNP